MQRLGASWWLCNTMATATNTGAQGFPPLFLHALGYDAHYGVTVGKEGLAYMQNSIF